MLIARPSTALIIIYLTPIRIGKYLNLSNEVQESSKLIATITNNEGYSCSTSNEFEQNRCIDYEKSKLERKRERNRIAASKCRQRKIERISTLEKQVTELKEDNQKLLELMQSFKIEVHNLRGQLQYHLERGCDVRNLRAFNNNCGQSINHIKSEFNIADSSTC
nr:transcription factor jun-1-like isoform X2 [Lepeophtheirus salmonis]